MLKLCFSSHAVEMSTVLPQPVKQTEATQQSRNKGELKGETVQERIETEREKQEGMCKFKPLTEAMKGEKIMSRKLRKEVNLRKRVQCRAVRCCYLKIILL